MSLKQLLGGAELEHHVCNPVVDSQQHIGARAQIRNAILPHRDPRPTGLVNGLHSRNAKQSSDNPSHDQNVGKPSKTNLHYSQSVTHHLSNNQRNEDGVVKYPEFRHHQPGFRQGDWTQRHDGRSHQVYNTLTRGGVYRQNFNDMVSISFSAAFWLVCSAQRFKR